MNTTSSTTPRRCRVGPRSGPAAGLRARWRRVAAQGDRGGATVELVIAMPVLMLMVLFVAQAAVWMHATHVAEAAANRALDAGAAYQGSATDGEITGVQTLAVLGSGVLRDPRVTVSRTATDVRVDIDGTAATVVPGIRWHVHATASGPVERFVPASHEFTNPERFAGGNPGVVK